MSPRLDTSNKPVWTLVVDWFAISKESRAQIISTILVYDHEGECVAVFSGPGMRPNGKDRALTQAEAFDAACKYVWSCGAKPKIKREVSK